MSALEMVWHPHWGHWKVCPTVATPGYCRAHPFGQACLHWLGHVRDQVLPWTVASCSQALTVAVFELQRKQKRRHLGAGASAAPSVPMMAPWRVHWWCESPTTTLQQQRQATRSR